MCWGDFVQSEMKLSLLVTSKVPQSLTIVTIVSHSHWNKTRKLLFRVWCWFDNILRAKIKEILKKYWKMGENCRKPHFGPILAPFCPILGQNIFSQKSDFVTFLDLLKANLMQESRKKLIMGSMRTFVTDRQTELDT